MLDETTPRGRLIAAALKLAAERPWREVCLLDIAEGAGVTLADLRTAFNGKTAIVSGFVRAVDDALLAQAKRPASGDGARDALFEVIMARLDLLGPYKPALRSIMSGMGPDPSMLRTMLCSQHWMLQAAGVDTAGARGAVRTLGLASLYASVFRSWLDDEDPGMARTMAALDRRLRRGESNLKALDGACAAASGLGRRLGELFGAVRRDGHSPASGGAAPHRPAAGNSATEAGKG